MNKIRFRRILEIQYHEGCKKGRYFNRKTYKQIFKLWRSATRAGKTKQSYDEFCLFIITNISRGTYFSEMHMRNKQLDKSTRNYIKSKEVAEC